MSSFTRNFSSLNFKLLCILLTLALENNLLLVVFKDQVTCGWTLFPNQLNAPAPCWQLKKEVKKMETEHIVTINVYVKREKKIEKLL